ncbi:hypothetical protein ACFRCG_19450 [Embleya sp. NPDC056575]|uniref:hypothetical protein n=1 Tax=unclassified Embleya TaxID=2699296 RepID=UPI00369827C5
MPTPHGDQGMAFSAHEVRVLRRALTVALRGGRDSVDFWLLGRAIGEAHDERERLRAFMTAELRRYRAALPGSAATFLSCLRNAVEEVAHVPSAEDLAALRTIVDLPCGPRERASRAALLRRCTRLAEAALEQRLTARAHRRAAAEADRATRPDPLDILIPGRATAAPPPSRSTAGTARPTPPPAPAQPTTRETEAHAPAPPEPAAVEPEATRPADPAVPEPEVVEPEATEPTASEATRSEHSEPKAVGPEAHEPETRAPEVREPGAHGSEASTLEHEAPTPESTLEDAPTTPPAVDVRPTETLSQVIPHRRQGRILGQLPTPEILQTGTG